jgi:NitT/TauT family transport system substrate-binding protein
MRMAVLALAVGLLVATACAPAPAGAPAAPPPAGSPREASVAPAAEQPAAGAASLARPASAPQPLSPPVRLKLGGVGIAAEGAFFIAMERGYFAEEGLDVAYTQFRSGADMMPSLATGEMHIGSAPPDAPLFNAVGRDIELKIINHNSLVTSTDHGSVLSVRKDLVDSGRYREYKDLKGMTFGLAAPGGSGQLYVERVLTGAGLTAADVNWVTISVPDMLAAFTNGAIEAAWHYEPFSSAAKDQGVAVPVAAIADIYPGVITTAAVLSPVFAKEQPEAVRRFAVAHLRAQRDYWHAFVKDEGGKDEIIQIFTKHTIIKDPALYARMSMHGVDPNGLIDEQILNDVQDYYLRTGTQRQKIDASRLVDRSYVEYALERLGRVPTP